MPLLRYKLDYSSIRDPALRNFIQVAAELLEEFEKNGVRAASSKLLVELNQHLEQVDHELEAYQSASEFAQMAVSYLGEDVGAIPVKLYDLYSSLNGLIYDLGSNLATSH